MTTIRKNRKSRLALAIGLSLGLCVMSSAASAATFDFANLADTLGEGVWGSIIAGGTHFESGIGVTASASNDGAGGFTGTSRAYLDAGVAGLGVCSIANCASSSDDNTGIVGDGAGGATALETVSLTFTTQVSITDLFFRDRDHDPFSGTLSINGDPTVSVTNGLVVGGLGFLMSGLVFDFARNPGNPAIARDFYLDTATVTAIPLPAALPLFAGGLGVLGLLGWRRKRMTAAQV